MTRTTLHRPIKPLGLACLAVLLAGCAAAPSRTGADASLRQMTDSYLSGRYAECRQVVDRTPAPSAEAMLLEARSALALGQPGDAEQGFARAERTADTSLVRAEALFGRAEALTRQRKPTEAIPLWQKLIDDAAARNHIALDTALARLSDCLAMAGDRTRADRVRRRLAEAFADSPSPHLDQMTAGTVEPVQPRLPKVNPEGSFFVQVAAVTQWKNVERTLRDLRAKGFTARHENDRRGLVLVLVGPYGSTADANAVRLRLIGRGYPGAFVKKR